MSSLKKSLLSAGAVLVASCAGVSFITAGAAHAADLPIRAAAPAPMFTAVPFTWSGFYVGLNAGYGIAKQNTRQGLAGSGSSYGYNSGYAFESGAATRNGSGVLGGAQIGYNLQLNSLVLGIEADISMTRMKSASTQGFGIYGSGFGSGALATSVTSNINSLGTLRGRIGVAFDKSLFYFTGGLAYGRVKNTFSIADDYGYALSYSQNKWKTGWVAGAGAEYAIDRNWSVKVEGLYFDLGSTRLAGTMDSGKFAAEASTKNAGFIARMGVNYRF